MERKKGRSGSIRISIHSNVSIRIIFIHSNISKSFRNQQSNTLYCFANRYSSHESSNSMDEKLFLKKTKFTRYIGRLFSVTIIERQSKERVNINRE